MTEVDTSARGRLLDRIVDYGSNHGLAEHSLRTIASGVGSSHRMLIHHFGSRDALVGAVIATLTLAVWGYALQRESKLQPVD